MVNFGLTGGFFILSFGLPILTMRRWFDELDDGSVIIATTVMTRIAE